MITKETARRIYNCYQQIEEIDKLKGECSSRLKKPERARKRTMASLSQKTLSEDSGKGCNSECLTDIPRQCGCSTYPQDIGLKVMDEQRERLEKDMRELETIAKLELSAPNNLTHEST